MIFIFIIVFHCGLALVQDHKYMVNSSDTNYYRLNSGEKFTKPASTFADIKQPDPDNKGKFIHCYLTIVSNSKKQITEIKKTWVKDGAVYIRKYKVK